MSNERDIFGGGAAGKLFSEACWWVNGGWRVGGVRRLPILEYGSIAGRESQRGGGGGGGRGRGLLQVAARYSAARLGLGRRFADTAHDMGDLIWSADGGLPLRILDDFIFVAQEDQQELVSLADAQLRKVVAKGCAVSPEDKPVHQTGEWRATAFLLIEAGRLHSPSPSPLPPPPAQAPGRKWSRGPCSTG